MERNQIKLGDKVKCTLQNFIGTIHKEDFGTKIIVMPDKPELKELYPFGIVCDIKTLIPSP